MATVGFKGLMVTSTETINVVGIVGMNMNNTLKLEMIVIMGTLLLV